MWGRAQDVLQKKKSPARRRRRFFLHVLVLRAAMRQIRKWATSNFWHENEKTLNSIMLYAHTPTKKSDGGRQHIGIPVVALSPPPPVRASFNFYSRGCT